MEVIVECLAVGFRGFENPRRNVDSAKGFRVFRAGFRSSVEA